MSSSGSSAGSRAFPLGLTLAVASALGYLLIWSSLNGFSGCGPPTHSASGRIFVVAPLAFPMLAATILGLVGARARWRLRTLVTAILMTIATAAVLEIVVFLLEFGAHHCGE